MAAYVGAGWLIGTLFYQLGDSAWILIPLALLPAYAGEVVMVSQGIFFAQSIGEWLNTDALPAVLMIALVVAFMSVILAVNLRQVQTTNIK